MKSFTDSFKLDSKIEEGPAGSIIVPARLTRVGVFDYGSYQQFRSEDEVFSEDSLKTLNDIPLTMEHPMEAEVNPDNFKDQVIGHVINGTVEKDGDFVKAKVMISEASAIDIVKSKKMLELSCGYTAFEADEQGEYNGIPYDSVQKDIKYNHLSLVPEGRAGPQCRLIVDRKHKDKNMVDESKNAQEEVKADLEAKLAEAVAKIDSMKEELAEAKSPAFINKLVKDRKVLIDTVKSICDLDEEKMADADPMEVKKMAIIEKFPGFELEGKSEDFILGMFDALAMLADTEAVSGPDAESDVPVEAPEVSEADACAEKEDIDVPAEEPVKEDSEEVDSEEEEKPEIKADRAFKKINAETVAKVADSSNELNSVFDEFQKRMLSKANEPSATGITK